MAEPTAVNDPHSAMLLPAKYVEALEREQRINLCCRHVEEENHTAQWFATESATKDAEGRQVPDVLVITCGKCKRKHRRFFIGGADPRVIIEKR